MTHILEDIREDALKFMDLWVTAGGQIVVNGFWDKVSLKDQRTQQQRSCLSGLGCILIRA